MNSVNNSSSISEYINNFSGNTKSSLEEVYNAIKSVVGDATETISYGMPTFKMKNNLVHFAGYGKHIGFYPTPSAIVKFEKELSGYKTSKGAVQFPLDKPMPIDLIKRITKFRVDEEQKM